MPSLPHLIAFSVTALVFVVIPGPSVLFTIGRALSVGRREALLTVAGNSIGEALLVVLVAVGLGAVVSASATLFTLIRIVGALYLTYLGVQAIRHRRSLVEAVGPATARSTAMRAIGRGFVVGTTNPKTLVFFAAILPQFAEPSLGHVWLQMLALGAVFPVLGIMNDTCVALGASTFRTWFARSPRRLEIVGGTGGLAMIAVGIGLLVNGRNE